jgi:hypothetical protein
METGKKPEKDSAVPSAAEAFTADLSGGGAIAQGEGAVAVGAGAVYVGGNVVLQAPKERPPAPFQAPPPAADHVPRAHELAHLKQHLLDADGQLLPNTVGLHGIGGAGKTTLARLFCADAPVRQACSDGILWVLLGKNPPEPRAQIADLVTALIGECGGCATLQGARAQLQAALQNRKVLLVLDDVWDEAAIRDVLEVSTGCARLITTRNTYTLPYEAKLVDLGTMAEEDATRLLGAGLPPGDDPRLLALARQLGRWPVLMRLANRTLNQRIQHQRMPVSKALDAVERDLARKGVLAFDPARETTQRDQAVAATVEASLELLEPDERQRYGELAMFPQDVPIPLARAAELWQLTAGLDAYHSENMVATRLDPLSLLDYDGDAEVLRLHDVLRSYLAAKLTDKASLHLRLAKRWSDRPARGNAYAWRWLAFHRAQAAMASAQPQKHALATELVALVSDENWQQAHEDALADLPRLREALSRALEAAVANDLPQGVPLIVQAADTLVRFGRDRLRPEPIFDLARQGDLDAARRRISLYAIDEHWRQALLLMVAWLAPVGKRDEAHKLCDEIRAGLAPDSELHNLLPWIRADLWGEAAPGFGFPVPPCEADGALIEELLKRVGGGEYSREFIVSRGLDPDVQDPDRPPPTPGLHRTQDEEQTTTVYLAELDGPYLVTYAAQDPAKGMDALQRYLSVYTNYNYPEYRFSTLWLLLGHVIALPRPDGGAWVREAVERILGAALGGGSVEFEQGLAVAATALRAQAGDPQARRALEEQAHQLMEEAAHIKPGRDRHDSDIWAHHKRLMLANAQALGWLLGDDVLAGQVLHEASELADSGFAGYQAPACLALAEAIHVCRQGDPGEAAPIEQALEFAQRAAHNVQDPTFCARMTARVNAMRQHWWQGFSLEERARHLDNAAPLPELAALHRVGHEYAGRRPDALKLPAWATGAGSFDDLVKLYQRPKPDILRLNAGERQLNKDDEVAVPDPGLAPHLAARLAAEALAQAGRAPLPADRMQVLRSLVPHAVPSPTALDAVLTRLVLAQARRETPPDLTEATALEAVLARCPAPHEEAPATELTTVPPPGRLPA